MTERRPGPDHALYPHRPLPGRTPLRWPGTARTALCVFLYLEDWELDPPAGARRDVRLDGPLGSVHPNYKAFAQYEHGNRIGIFRLLALLDRLGLTPTVPAGAGALRKYPYLVAELKRRGAEFVAHGSHATRMLSSEMDAAAQRAAIGAAIAAVTDVTGTAPTGWMGQDYGESPLTPQLVAEAGLGWLCDWGNDDRPYAMSTTAPLLSIPNQAEWDDVQIMTHRRIPPAIWRAGLVEAFDVLHGEGGAFFGVHLHPWLTGMPHRIAQVEAALGHVAAGRDLWRTTAGAVARHVVETGQAV